MERRAISLAHSTLEDKALLAEKAGRAGFTTIWNSGESLTAFAAMAMVAPRSKVGSGVIRGFAHVIRNLAQHSADLNRLTGGRFILGLGGGTKRLNIKELGKEFDHPASRIAEMIRLLRAYWYTPQDRDVEFSGRFYSGGGPGFGLSEDRPIPVWVAAVNKAMFRLAGTHCEGVCNHPIASIPFIENVSWPSIDEGLRRSGRTRQDFTHSAWITTAISHDRAQALRELKHDVGRFMATRSYAIVLDSQGLEKVRLQIQDAFFNSKGDPDKLIDAVPDEVAAAHGIYGTPDEVREQAKRYHGVVDMMTFYSPTRPMTKERIRENLELIIETFGE